MYVIVNAGWSVALYCQRCGKIHIHDISYFAAKNHAVMLRCVCNHPQATLARTASSKHFRLDILCVVCNSVHQEILSPKQLLKMKVEKIYCGKDHFELGYIGKRQKIEEILAFNQHAFETMNGEETGGQIEKQRILLDVLNKLHDIAEQDGVHCPCGSDAIAGDILGNSVILECRCCGGYFILPAKNEQDLAKVNKLDQIELVQGRFLVKNIDLD